MRTYAIPDRIEPLSELGGLGRPAGVVKSYSQRECLSTVSRAVRVRG